MYDGSSDFVNFAGAFTAYYQAGVAGTPISAVKSNLSSGVSTNVLRAAYLSGQMDSIVQNNGQRSAISSAQEISALPNGINNDTIDNNYDDDSDFEVIYDGESEAERNESSGGNGKRSHRVAPRKSGGSVQGRTGKKKAGSETQRRRAESIKNNVNAKGVERVTTASQGISIGTNNPTLQVVPRELYTKEMKAISKEQFAKGRRVIFFVGQLEMKQNGEIFTTRGALSKDGKRIWIQADNPNVTIEQIAKHEEFHALVKKDADLLDRTRRQVIARYGEAELQELVDSYIDAYAWTELSDEYILEEILADAYAEIDIFDYLTDYEGATRFSDTVQESAKSARYTPSGIENNTGQEQFSRSKGSKLTLAQKKAYEEREIFERQRQDQMRKYMRENNETLPEEWCSYGEDYFYAYENYSMMDYRVIFKIKITDKNSNRIQKIERRLKGDGREFDLARRADDRFAHGEKSSQYADNRNNVNASEARGAGRVYEVDDHSSGSDSSTIDKEGIGNLNGGRTSGLTEKFSRSSPTITQENIRELRSIGRKSVNAFTAEDIKKAEPFARRAWQELGVKSPFFRAWFGDWRSSDTTPVVISTRKGNSRGVVTNNDTGFDINISRKIFNETTSHNALPNVEAVEYLQYINDIVENAVLLDTVGSDKDGQSLFMHTFYALADIGNGPVLLKLYVEEINDVNADNTIKRAYQLQNIEKKQSAVTGWANESLDRIRQTASVKTIADLFELVKQKDKSFVPQPVNPVLLNEDGTPKKFYHGTSERFTIFSYEELRQREGSFFFAENKEDAEGYGGNVLEVYLTGEKFADYDNQPSEFYRLKDKREQVEWLKKRGYDGWYSDMDGGWGEVSVFNPNQIKSATDNIGTFDAGNPDIRFSRESSLYIQEENERIRKDYQNLKQKLREMKRQRDYWKDEATSAPVLNRDDVKSVTEYLLSSYSSKADKTATFNALKKLGEFIIRGGDRSAALEWSTVKEKAVEKYLTIMLNR